MKAATISDTSVRLPPARLSSRRTHRKELRLRKLLVPIDFSEPSRNALNYAHAFGRYFSAELDLVHVSEPNHPYVDSTALPLILPDREIGPQVRRDLQNLASEHGIELRRENIHALKGSPFEQICRLVSELKSDLVIISTHGNTGLKHLVLGSTAERVVRNSPCPVLVIRASRKRAENNGVRPAKPPRFQKILVPVDFSKCSLDGLAYAKKLAAHFESKLILLHAVHLQYYVSNDEYARYDFPMVMRHAEAFAKDQMRELVQITEWDGVKFEPVIEVGHAGQQICERAVDRDIDLIVTSTHGHTGWKHMFLGSTAEYVVRHAPIPVLVVPSKCHPALPNQN